MRGRHPSWHPSFFIFGRGDVRFKKDSTLDEILLNIRYRSITDKLPVANCASSHFIQVC